MAQHTHAPAPLHLAQYEARNLGPDGAPVPLGSGSYAAVWQYLDTDTKKEVAIKRIRLTGLLPSEVAAVRKYLQSELLNHHRLRHPHVVELQDVFVEDGHINLVMELASGGTLFDSVQRRVKARAAKAAQRELAAAKQPWARWWSQLLFGWAEQRVRPRAVNAAEEELGIGEPLARWWFQQLVMTMDYFHQKGVAHRDIKLENTLLQIPAAARSAANNGAAGDPALPQQQQQQPAPLRPIIKVADFGLSKCDAQVAFTLAGTPDYMAPEVATALHPVRGYDPVSADVWSAGVMLMVMLLGRYPFDATAAKTEQEALRRKVTRPLRLPASVSPGCRELLEALLHPDPAHRITIEGIKQHPWFLVDLVPGALGMTARYLHAPSRCRKTAEQVQAVAQEALRIVNQGQNTA